MNYALQHGIDIIRSYLHQIGNQPGVYQMIGESDQTLYVGKAKALKKRVASYTQANRLSDRLIKMVSSTQRMEFITTHTETEALLLEANLIRKKKPHYNILLKDDKSFPYIFLDKNHAFPKVVKHRGAKKHKGHYFGPFATVGAVNHTLNLMQRMFMIRNCKDSDFANRSRPCLQYHIKRCTAPCVDYVSKDDYAVQISDAKAFLSGKSRQVIDRTAKAMEQASIDMDYERAAILRDRIKALSALQTKQHINIKDIDDADIISAKLDKGKACVQVFFIRAGQNLGAYSTHPQVNEDDTISDLMSNFIAQFYRNKPVPKTLLLNAAPKEQALLEEALSEDAGFKITITVPQRGNRKKLIDWAEENLKTTFDRYLQASMTDHKARQELSKLFGMEKPPERIEIYDNSHISGEHMIGAMVVAGVDGFEKTQYRLFNIKTANKQDDFDMMREVMRRRFSRALKEHCGPGTSTWPDLLLIDGGKGQLSAVIETLEPLGVLDNLTIVAISKGPDRNAGREEFHMRNRPSFDLPPRDQTLFYLQRLRDEAHRFAIGSHRAKRKKTMTDSSLDHIEGIGPKRKKALLMHFGSAKAVERAGIDDLMGVDGISTAMAEMIYNHYR